MNNYDTEAFGGKKNIIFSTSGPIGG